MRVLVAGATGAIGRPLTRELVNAGHEVLGLARSQGSAVRVEETGGRPVRADAMDRDGLLEAVKGLNADAVIHQMTALARPKRTLNADDPSTALRVTGTANLLEAAAELGARRFLTQSMVTGYGYRDHGDHVLTEDDPFARCTGSVADHVIKGLMATEAQALGAGGIALRYGVLYGPGTWFDASGRKARALPVPTDGGGVMSWIHVEDAATATVAALERGGPSEAYNIVGDTPATWGHVASVTAATRGRRPTRMPGRLLRLAVPYLGALMIDTTLRASNEKATRELGWQRKHNV
ncbi:NAD-dependent epimerase/dehydratase family protein [Streptomyces sp. 184]|uniref:NAD-dependent epimerase/dehydratase family protein n=1 Tax=Streptomyces sp. 184 TaxID=1827526 RepID=UPI00389254D6